MSSPSDNPLIPQTLINSSYGCLAKPAQFVPGGAKGALLTIRTATTTFALPAAWRRTFMGPGNVQQLSLAAENGDALAKREVTDPFMCAASRSMKRCGVPK